jgi:hypothetical protein
MKKIVFSIVVSIIHLIGISQIQVDPDIFMQFDLEKEPISYKRVLIKTNPPGPIHEDIYKVLANFGIRGYNYYSYFPQIKRYSTDDIRKKIKGNEIEAILEIFIEINSISEGQSFTTYNYFNKSSNNINSFGFSSDITRQHFSGALFIFDHRDWDNPIAISNGNFSGYRNKSLILRIVVKTLIGLEENDLLIKLPKIKFRDLDFESNQ